MGISCGRGSSPLTLAPVRRKFSCFPLHKKWIPRSTRRGCPGTSNDWCSNPFYRSRAITTNEIQIRLLSDVKTKNEIQIRLLKWCENEKRNSNPFFKVMWKRKTKFISVFQSDTKTKNEKRSSNAFFNVRRKRKTNSKIQTVFQCHAKTKNEKWKWNLNSIFPCHRKTVGTKVHALTMLMQNFGETNKEHYGMLWYFWSGQLFTFTTSICRLFSGADWLILGIEAFLRWKWIYCGLAVALERTVFPFVKQYIEDKMAAECCYDLTFRGHFFEKPEKVRKIFFVKQLSYR